jgi:xanthine/uracil permease
VGRIVGRVVARILEAAKVNKIIEDTPIGELVRHTGMDILEFLDALARWFIYLIFIMASVNILDIALFSQFLEKTVDYLPSFIAGVVILIVGLAVADFMVTWIKNVTKTMNIQGGEVLEAAIRVFLFLVIALLALDQMRIDTTIIRLFLGPLAWALAIILIFKWGVKDALVEYARAKGK